MESEEKIKEAEQTAAKRQEMIDVHKLLMAFYEAIGWPAGCRISKTLTKHIPRSDISNMKAIRYELLTRQRVRTAITEQTIETFRSVVTRNGLISTFIVRQRICQFLPKEEEQKQTREEQSIARAYKTKDGRRIQNDKQSAWIVKRDNGYLDVLSGERFDDLTPCE